MKPIRKFEAEYVRQNGFSKYVKSSITRHRHKEYFLVENVEVVQFLENYLDSIRVK